MDEKSDADDDSDAGGGGDDHLEEAEEEVEILQTVNDQPIALVKKTSPTKKKSPVKTAAAAAARRKKGSTFSDHKLQSEERQVDLGMSSRGSLNSFVNYQQKWLKFGLQLSRHIFQDIWKISAHYL